MNTHKLRVPTPDPFAFIEFEFPGTAEEAIDEYRRLTVAVKENGGLADADWRAVLDDFLDDGSISGDPGSIEKMNSAQRWCINEVKKGLKRLNK